MPKSFRLRQIKIKKKSTKRGTTNRKSRSSTLRTKTKSSDSIMSMLNTLRSGLNQVSSSDILKEMKRLINQDKMLSVLLYITKGIMIADGSEKEIISYRETLFVGIMRMKKCIYFQYIINVIFLNLHNYLKPLLGAMTKYMGRGKTQHGGMNLMQIAMAIIGNVFIIQTLIQAQIAQSDMTGIKMDKSGVVPIDFKHVDNLHPTEITIQGKKFEPIKQVLMENPMHTCDVTDEETGERCMEEITESFNIKGSRNKKNIKLTKPIQSSFMGTSYEDLFTTFNQGSFELNENMKHTCNRIIEMEERELPNPITWKHENIYSYLKKEVEELNKRKKDEYVRKLKEEEEENKRRIETLKKESKKEEIKSIGKKSVGMFFFQTPSEVVPVEQPGQLEPIAEVQEIDFSTYVPPKVIEHGNKELAILTKELQTQINEEDMNKLIMDMAQKGLCEKGKCPTSDDSQDMYNILLSASSKFQPELQKTFKTLNRKDYFERLCNKAFDKPVMAFFNKTATSMEVHLPTNWYMIRIVIANMIYHLERDYPSLIQKELTEVDLSKKTDTRLKSLYELSVVFLKIINDFEETMVSTYRLNPSTTTDLKKTSIRIFESTYQRIQEMSDTNLPVSKKYTAEQQVLYQQKRDSLQQKREQTTEQIREQVKHFFDMTSSFVTPVKESTISAFQGIGEILVSSAVDTIITPASRIIMNAGYLGQDMLQTILTYSSIGVLIILIIKFGIISKTASFIHGVGETAVKRLTRKRRSPLQIQQPQQQISAPAVLEEVSSLQVIQPQPVVRPSSVENQRVPPKPLPGKPIEYYMNPPYGAEYFMNNHIIPVRPDGWPAPPGYAWIPVSVTNPVTNVQESGWTLAERRRFGSRR
jgi:hypothetical protein